MAFHDIDFPLALSRRISGGPVRRTEIVSLVSGHEERNQLWANSRRRYNAGTGLRSLDDLHALIAFFEARRGRFHGFRFRDPADHRSAAPSAKIVATDQALGSGDSAQVQFPLIKTYGDAADSYARRIVKPVAASVLVALDGAVQSSGFTLDAGTGIVTFDAAPASGVAVSAGFVFDTPVRFDTDELQIDHDAFTAGAVPDVPMVELRLKEA